LSHLRSLSFFTPDPIGESLFYYSAYAALEQGGLDGLLQLLQTIVRDQRPQILAIDSLSAVPALGASELAQKNFVRQLQTWGQTYGCTTFLIKLAQLTTFDTEYTMVDGIIELSDHLRGLRAFRQLDVRKFRGSGYLRGRHLFDITSDGLVVYPRTEAVLSGDEMASPSLDRVGFGNTALNEMVGGGLLAGSTTATLGVTGSGKTLLGLNFLAEGARQGEPCLYFGFGETPAELMISGKSIGLLLDQYITDGTLDIVWHATFKHVIDELTASLLDHVQRRGVKRLVIDGLDNLKDTAVYPEHFSAALGALVHRLQNLGVTTLASVELPELFGSVVQIPLDGLTSVCDNILFLRQVELHSQLYRLISVMKMRGSQHSRAIREFTVSEQGIDVASTFESAEAILTGLARPLPPLLSVD